MKKTALILISVALVFSLCSCSNEKEQETYHTSTVYNTQQPESATTQVVSEPSTTEPVTETPTVPLTEIISDTVETVPPSVPPTTVAQTESDAEDTTVGKTGEMAFSDAPDNRYIAAVAQKYTLSAKNLVAIYTIPQNDSNMVLEFSGKTDSSGKIIRDSSTLVAIYTIDADLNSKRASKDSAKNEYDYGEMCVMFLTVTTYIMPEFADYL